MSNVGPMAQDRVFSIQPLTGGGSVPEWRLSDRLRRAREWAHLDQQQLATLTGLSRASISAAENGHRAPRAASVRLWAVATGVSVAWLETGQAPPPGNDQPAGWWFESTSGSTAAAVTPLAGAHAAHLDAA